MSNLQCILRARGIPSKICSSFLVKRVFERYQGARRQLTSLPSTKIYAGQQFEEETLPWYSPSQFYPVLGKLGYDTGFVAIRVCARNTDRSGRVHRELQFYHHVSSLGSQHCGQRLICGLFEMFEISGSSSQHLCLVHPSMHMIVQELQYKNQSHRLNQELLKWMFVHLLNALSFLHDEAKVVQADINPPNIMLTTDAEDPSPTNVIDNGQPALCGFGEARIEGSHRGLVVPELYRTPEVLFEMEWGASADIWNVAVSNRHLFAAVDENLESLATHHFAEMDRYLGLPSLEYIQISTITKSIFDERGSVFLHLSFDAAVSVLDSETKEQFPNFIGSMLKCLPEQRKQASELLKDPWMAVPSR
ncbi:kinase-like protein [Eremomyces bilateralis CBS 781.70]|uniref:Kinase-like protein n=1 Tax=Eremomyces bilateralis CBS 781.70 TaxID=1392243 RepID=A0A6G1G8T9_9PEZI|nr:kinase-like protein [Eremomyces bilateralis CBS 781.70]KAF1814487.1 kinase-like protein [Eremomyces bilateralis CBS 781.70]